MRRGTGWSQGFIVALVTALMWGERGVASAQILPPPPPELSALEWLIGEWEGEGWFAQGQGRAEFRGTEQVERRMGGRVVVMEGHYSAWMGPERGEVPVHEAMGVFWVDPDTRQLLFRMFTAGGEGGETHARVEADGSVIWAFGDRGGVRFTSRRTPSGEWHQVGERSGDGETWTRFLEMRLRRVQIPGGAAPAPLTPARTP